MPKSVETLIIRSLHNSMLPHAPDDGKRASNEHNLHKRVIHRDEVSEEIQVSSEEDERVQLLSLERDP